MKNARVFLAHPVRVAPKNPGMASSWKFNIAPVLEFGELIWFFEDSEMMLSPDLARMEIRRLYRHHSLDPFLDFILAAGDMTMFGLMLVEAVELFGVVPRVLRHNRQYDRYDVLPAIDYNEEVS